MSRFSFRPAVTLRGRAFRGLRGWSGKPLHPPLTDIPIGAYVLTAGFDVVSRIGGADYKWGYELYKAGTFAMVAGLVVSVLTALTGFWDWWKGSEPETPVRRTANAHALIMITATVLVVFDVVWRTVTYDANQSTPGRVAALSVAIAGLVALGAAYGGSLVYDHGFNVESAGEDVA